MKTKNNFDIADMDGFMNLTERKRKFVAQESDCNQCDLRGLLRPKTPIEMVFYFRDRILETIDEEDFENLDNYERGLLWMLKGDFENAESCLWESLKVDKVGKASVALSNLYLNSNNPNLAQLAKSILIEGFDLREEEAFELAARLSLIDGSTQDAISIYTEGIRMGIERLNLGLGEILMERGNLREALQCYYYALDGGYNEALVDLARYIISGGGDVDPNGEDSPHTLDAVKFSRVNMLDDAVIKLKVAVDSGIERAHKYLCLAKAELLQRDYRDFRYRDFLNSYNEALEAMVDFSPKESEILSVAFAISMERTLAVNKTNPITYDDFN